MTSEVKEFESRNLAAAIEFIRTLPKVYRRIYVEVCDDSSAWHLVYGDDRSFAPSLLSTVIQGRRFRIRGSDEILRLSRIQLPTA